MRFHGHADVVTPDCSAWSQLSASFPQQVGARSIIDAKIARVSDSCGYAVPKFEYVAERDALVRWAQNKGNEGLVRYREEKNARSTSLAKFQIEISPTSIPRKVSLTGFNFLQFVKTRWAQNLIVFWALQAKAN